MADLDELQIKITSSSQEAENAIDKLVKNLENLNTALGKLDVRKVNSFARAISKIAESTSGLNTIADSFNKISSAQMPDMSNSVKGIENLKKAAQKTCSEVEGLTGKLSKVQTVIEGNEIKKYERGFSMKDTTPIKNVEFPPAVINQIETVSDIYQEKLLPAIINTQHQADMLNQHLMNIANVEAVYDAVTQKFIDFKTQLMELNGATSGEKWIVPELKGNADFKQMQTGWISDIQSSGFRPYFNDVEESAQKCLPAIVNVQETALALADQFKNVEAYATEAFEKATAEAEKAKSATDMKGETPLQKVVEGAEKAKSAIEQALEEAREFKRIISDMESGKTDFNQSTYDNALKGYNKAVQVIKDYKNELLGVKKEEGKVVSTDIMGDTLSNFIAIGNELEHIAQGFGKLADGGIKILKVAFIPLKHVVQEYKEKFDGLRDSISGFVKNIQTKLKKLSDFWKRTMRTFTFMVIRSAITQIIKEVGTAVQSLAMYSNAMGTAFNTDLSNMVADFQYLGRSIVSVFAPLLSFISPIIDAIVDKIATLLSYIGMLFTALGGGTSFTKAKKNVGNYAESLDQASKSAKNLTMGIDELNIISENKSGGSAKPYDGWEDAWEDVDIPDWIKDLSDKLKGIFDKLFDPLKKAWDRAKQYVYDGFKTMVNSLKRLFSDIGKDFLEVWNQEKTIHMFEQLFKIIGDIFRIVRNLANAFDEAWKHNKTGFKILENIRDILYIIVEHVRNISYYMVEWSKKIDFKPLLTTFEELTRKAKKLADFIGGVIEDIFVYGILKYIDFLIRDALPHLNETIGEIIDAFNFKTLRKNLQPVIVAIEEMFENIHTGVTTAIGNIGKVLAQFTNSKEFADFLQRIVEITRLITAERVAKVLTALGKAIISVAKAVVKFINSDAFMKFLEAIAKWIDNASVDQIANVLSAIATAILGFRFVEFTLGKISGFLKFISVIVAIRNLKNIATELTELGGATKVAGEGAEVLAASGEKLVGLPAILGGIGTALGGIVTAVAEFKLVADGVEELTLALNGDDESSLVGGILKVIATVGIAGAAFTALLGVPAGIIATAVVGVVAAIKGIDDAIQQINFDHVTDAIMTQGDTTVQRVNEWYDQSTEIISTHVTEWKNIERDLVQGRGDIDEYANSIRGLTSAFDSHVQLTTRLSSELVGSYEDMGNCINNYIDTSTNSMVANLMAQRSYLEAQGKDVDTMIANLLVGAEEQKGVVDDAVESMQKAQEAYAKAVEEHGKDSKEAQTKYEELKQVINETSGVFESFQSTVDETDTSAAVEQINNLGKSLDFSQYGSWDEAVTAISGSIQEIKTATESGLQDINDTYQSKLDELNEYKARNPMFSKEDYEIQKDVIISQWADDTQQLTYAAQQALDLYDSSLATKLQEVADSAEQEWDSSSPFKRWANRMGEKDDYVYSQMQNYVNEHLGDTGLTGLINEAYAAIPNNTHQSAVSALTDLVNDGAREYERAVGTLNVDEMGKLTYTPYQKTLDAIPDLVEYDSASEAFMNRGLNAAKLAAEGAHYDELARTIVDGEGNALLANQSEFEDYNRMMAGYGVNAMSDEYKTKLSDNAELYEAIKGFGSDTVTSYNLGVDESSGETETSIKTWGDNIVQWFHDCKLNFGSPSQTMIDFGKDTVEGYNLGISQNASSTQVQLNTWAAIIENTIRNNMTHLKVAVNSMITSIFSLSGIDITTPITTIFANISTTIQSKIDELGSQLTSSILPTFMQTYILPFFSVEMWQPYFDILLNEVFMVNFETFRTWFTEEAMTPFWEEDVLFWFEKEKWDDEIFTPLADNIHEHFDTFVEWWDNSMTNWWDEHVIPWFNKEKWRKQFNNIYDVTKEVFDLIRDAIKERIGQAAEAVGSACENMKSAIAEVVTAIGEMMAALEGFEGFEGSVTFDFGTPDEFALGGFPTQGTLFYAGEAGAELVGSVNGRTAVASNGEITGIADAVYATGNEESQLLAQIINICQQMLSKDPVVLGDRDLAMAVERGKGKMGMSIIT